MPIKSVWPHVVAALVILVFAGSAGARSAEITDDTTPPTVSITTPAEGETVTTNPLIVSGVASDDVRVAKVEVAIDGGPYWPARGTTDWTLSIDTSALGNGTHTLAVRATDSSGNTADAERTIAISSGGDSAVPTVSITSPARGATVSGLLTVSGVAADNVQVATVEVKVGGGPYELASGTTAWAVTIDTTAYGDGHRTLTARATDTSGNKAWSSIPITINNLGAANQIFWGAWVGSQLTGNQAPWDMGAVTAFESLTRKPLSLINFSAPFASCPSTCSFYNFDSAAFTNVRNHGAIPFFSWGSQSVPANRIEPDFQLSDLISGRYDEFVRNWATAARDWGHPFFLRFDWEMNGNWTPWSELVNGNHPGEFVQAWRHVHDIFTSVGATNATWVWCPNFDPYHVWAPLDELYPGDAYVDWTCLDGYNWGTNPVKPGIWAKFNQLFHSTYHQVVDRIAPSKPMIIGETASTEIGGSKAAWITDLLSVQLPLNYPEIRGFVWMEKGGAEGDGMDWPIESSLSAQNAFATAIGNPIYTSNTFGTIDTSPIPPP
jgi:hypothetical protein